MTLRLVSKPVNGGGDFGPPPTVPKESVGGKEREREREVGHVARASVSSPGTGKSSFEQHRNELS